MYNFFSASTKRWARLVNILEKKYVVQSLSDTRWSTRGDASKSLNLSYSGHLFVLKEISEDATEKPTTRAEALGLWKYFYSLETCLISAFWNDVLDRFNAVSSPLQSASATLSNVVELYESLE